MQRISQLSDAVSFILSIILIIYIQIRQHTFFGEDPSNFALLCFNHMKANNTTKVLEIGAGHGRDTTFFASNGIEVEALDYSVAAVEILDKVA